MTMDTVEILKNLLVQTGAGWVLWLLLLLSTISLAIVVERFLVFRAKSDELHGLAAMLDAHLRAGSHQEAITTLSSLRSAGAAVALAGLRLADRGALAAEKAMTSAMALERKALESRLAFLGTLGNNAPFIGLFGTVIGVILAFEELGKVTEATGGASQAVMGAIAEALVATAAGILVALPAVAFYNWFQRRIATVLLDAEALSNLVLAYLSEQGGRE
jgi:biopolymer transport protein ExbB